MRRTTLREHRGFGVMRIGSWLIVPLATLWLIERAFNLYIPALAFLAPGQST